MSKKKEINLKSTPAAVESGDVNITYNNVLVGSLSDSSTAVLKTEMTICEHDIELEYTKPAGEISLPEVNLTNTAGALISINKGVFLSKISGVIVTNYLPDYEKLYVVPVFDGRTGQYSISIYVNSVLDNLNVNINNTPVSFDSDGYYYEYASETYPEGFTIVITNKE